MLETLNSERVNIGRLSFEEPGPSETPLFDPGRDLSDEDWQNMKKHVELLLLDGKWEYGSQEAAGLKLLWPGIFNEVALPEGLWEWYVEKMAEYRNSLSWDNFLREVHSARILFPEKISFFLNREDFEGAINSLKKHLQYEHMVSYTLMQASYLKILFPYRAHELVFLEDYLPQAKESIFEEHRFPYWTHFGYIHASRIKMLFPSRGNEFLGEDPWGDMRHMLRGARANRYIPHLISGALAMKIFAAKDIVVAPGGVQIVMFNPTEEPIPPLPGRRRF